MENQKHTPVKIWGIVKDKKGRVVQSVGVRLIKKTKIRKRTTYEMIAEGVTDQLGRYQFEVEQRDPSRYQVYVVEKTLEKGGKVHVSQ